MMKKEKKSISNENEAIEQSGAVTFLDVLGWKGIWKDNPQAINILQKFIKEAEEKANEITLLLIDNEIYRGIETDVVSISDTIAIFTPGPPEISLAIHGELCKKLLPESIHRSIPLRGATSYGDYTRQENIMIGPAIDEAASWHESTNWIGVVMTPSAIFQLGGKSIKPWIEYSNIPYKSKTNLKYCVGWEMKEIELLYLFNKMGPFVPEIASKYINTHEFIKYMDK